MKKIITIGFTAIYRKPSITSNSTKSYQYLKQLKFNKPYESEKKRFLTTQYHNFQNRVVVGHFSNEVF